MKKVMRRGLLLSLILTSITVSIYADTSANDSATPYYSIRSQSEDTAREMVGWAHKVNLYGMDRFYGTVAITPEFTRSFDSFRIAKCIFGRDLDCSCDCPFLRISGSQRSDRTINDWMADYFGLPSDYLSTVFFQPRVDQFLVDINFYFGLDNWMEGLYFRIHAPIVNTRWQLGICECIEDRGVNEHAPGYFNTEGVTREQMVNSFREFISGCRVPAIDGIASNNLIPGPELPVFYHLRYGKMICETLVETQVSDLQAALGWNFWQDEDYHVGVSLRTAAPTGNRPDGEFLFEPIVGNGKHWELGGGLTAHYTMWRSEDESKSIGFYFDVNITHLFAARQRRSFDLLCRPNSRYMLAIKMTKFDPGLLTPDPNNASNEFSFASAVFNNIYAPVINLTTFDVDVSSSAQIDMSLMFNYRFKYHWDLDLGYNLWVRTCEQIKCRCCPTELTENLWALKGDEHVFGFTPDINGGANWLSLSATQNCADIHQGTFYGIPPLEFPGTENTNPRVDNAMLAFSANNNFNQVLVDLTGSQTNSSFQPRLLSMKDIDLCAARTKGLSHKFFINLQRSWDNHDWQPYVGVGGKVEIARFRPRCDDGCAPCFDCDSCISYCDEDCRDECFNCDTSCCCEPCDQCSLSEWGIWLKGGVSY